MTSIENALADPSDLGFYQDDRVIRTSIAVKGAGDGLSKSLGIDPQLLSVGSKGMLLLEYEVLAHEYKRVPDTDCFEVKQVLRAGTATIVDDNTSASKLRKQADAIQKAHDSAKGQDRLDGTNADDLEPSEGELAEAGPVPTNSNGKAEIVEEGAPDLSAFNG